MSVQQSLRPGAYVVAFRIESKYWGIGIEDRPRDRVTLDANPRAHLLFELVLRIPECHLQIGNRKIRIPPRLLTAEHQLALVADGETNLVRAAGVLPVGTLHAEGQLSDDKGCMLDEETRALTHARHVRPMPAVVRPQTGDTRFALDRRSDCFARVREIALESTDEKRIR